MPVYILDMLELPAEIKSAFEKGEFSIRQTSGSFNGIWSDMSFIALLNDVRKCLVSVHLARADF
jgi:hypothetical protein